MSSGSGQRIRLVRCPKCLKILQEDEDVPVYQCGGCSAILQAKRRNIAQNRAGETEEAQATVPPSEPEAETNTVSCNSGKHIVLQSSSSSSERSLEDQECEKRVESTEKKLGALDLSDDIQQKESSLGEYNTMAEAAGTGVSSGSSNLDDHDVAVRESNSSGNAEISPDASPVDEKQSQIDTKRTCSAYEGSESSSNEREEEEDRFLDEDEDWSDLEKIRSGKLEMPRRYLANYKDQGAASSSSSTFRNGTTKLHQNKSLQLERRFGRQGRRYVTEQLGRPNLPLYPRERVTPSYPSNDELDRYSRAYSLQTPPYNNNNNTRARGRDEWDRRNQTGLHSGQLHNSYSSYSASPQRPMAQYPRWSHQIVSDTEDHHHHHHCHQRNQQTRRHIAKRHIRPIAGGAPFVSCYNCSQNLNLPVDFLIFERKHHLVRCGNCNTVLRFSLQSRTHLVPAETSESPRDKRLSASSVKDEEEEEEEEEVATTRGSPLHRLMGYSTVSQVFKASQRPPSL